MAHFAEIDELNIVTTVIVVDNNELLEDGVELEEKGIAFCKSLFGEDTRWIQTSYNRTFRKNFAGVGHIYDSTKDDFYSNSPFPSWILNEETCIWEAPIPMPVDDNFYMWNELDISWDEVI